MIENVERKENRKSVVLNPNIITRNLLECLILGPFKREFCFYTIMIILYFLYCIYFNEI